MADVTDAAFRRLIAKHGKPDVMFTEFVSADGLFKGPPETLTRVGRASGRKALLLDLQYSERERPIVAQFFTAETEMMKRAAELAVELGFDGVDVNLGCPDRKVEKQGAGAALIKNPKLAQKIIRAAQAAAGKLPVSVKTRLGYNRNELDTWLPALLETELDAITIHLRTRQEMSAVPAHWELAEQAVKIRDRFVTPGFKTRPLIIGNGDAVNLDDARAKASLYGLDGVMLGRAIFGNPWLFSQRKKSPTPPEKLAALLEHVKLFEKYCSHKSFAVMKKHFKAYVTGWPARHADASHAGGEGAKELRIKLMGARNAEEVEKILKRSASH